MRRGEPSISPVSLNACVWCDGPISHRGEFPHSPQRFCSKTCREDYWTSAARLADRMFRAGKPCEIALERHNLRTADKLAMRHHPGNSVIDSRAQALALCDKIDKRDRLGPQWLIHVGLVKLNTREGSARHAERHRA